MLDIALEYVSIQISGNSVFSFGESQLITFPFNRKCREDLSEATQRLNEMIANYGDVVPRRDFEFLKADFEVSKTMCTACYVQFALRYVVQMFSKRLCS